MKLSQMLAVITADNDQDREHLKAWIAESSEEELMQFWLLVQQEFTDKGLECMSRFAAFAFASLLADHPELIGIRDETGDKQ